MERLIFCLLIVSSVAVADPKKVDPARKPDSAPKVEEKRNRFEDAYTLARERDKANSTRLWTFEFAAPTVTAVRHDKGWIKGDGTPKLRGRAIHIRVRAPSSPLAYDSNSKVERKFSSYSIHLSSKDENDAVYNDCEKKAFAALQGQGLFSIKIEGVKHHRLFISQVDLLLQYGRQKFLQKLTTEKEDKLPNIKKYMESIESLTQLRHWVAVSTQDHKVTCDLSSGSTKGGVAEDLVSNY